MMQKCPACGYNQKNNPRMGADMNRILKSKNRKTTRILNKIASIIMRNVPSETRLNYYQFLYGTQSIEDNVLEWAIETYYQSKHFEHGKGFAYLRSIAQNRNKNIDTLRRNERQRLGSTPPVYEGEEGWRRKLKRISQITLEVRKISSGLI